MQWLNQLALRLKKKKKKSFPSHSRSSMVSTLVLSKSSDLSERVGERFWKLPRLFKIITNIKNPNSGSLCSQSEMIRRFSLSSNEEKVSVGQKFSYSKAEGRFVWWSNIWNRTKKKEVPLFFFFKEWIALRKVVLLVSGSINKKKTN